MRVEIVGPDDDARGRLTRDVDTIATRIRIGCPLATFEMTFPAAEMTIVQLDPHHHVDIGLGMTIALETGAPFDTPRTIARTIETLATTEVVVHEASMMMQRFLSPDEILKKFLMCRF